MAMLSLVPVTKQIIWGGERLSRDFDIGKAGEKIAEAWELTCRNDGDNEIAGGEYGGTLLPHISPRTLRRSVKSGTESDFRF